MLFYLVLSAFFFLAHDYAIAEAQRAQGEGASQTQVAPSPTGNPIFGHFPAHEVVPRFGQASLKGYWTVTQSALSHDEHNERSMEMCLLQKAEQVGGRPLWEVRNQVGAMHRHLLCPWTECEKGAKTGLM